MSARDIIIGNYSATEDGLAGRVPFFCKAQNGIYAACTNMALGVTAASF
jgi:hypothetical protein